MIDWTEILIRLSSAAFLGALIGLERERKDGASGLRTHMMVSVGACLFMIVSAFGFSDALVSRADLDPSRVAAQVASGIGFIGAGSIMFLKQGVVRGLTTASGLWTVAAIGLASGGGMYFAATATALIAVIILWLLKPVEEILFKKTKGSSLSVKVNANAQSRIPESVQNLIHSEKLKIQSFSLEKMNAKVSILLKLIHIEPTKADKILHEFSLNEDVIEIFWEN